MGKKQIAAVIAIATVVVAGAAIGYRAHKVQATAEGACVTIEEQIEDRGASIHIPGTGPSVAIIGDSYTSGDGLDDHRGAWAHHWANATAADTHIAGIGNTGYTNGGFCGTHHFQSRIDELPVHDVLVIQGGLNDWNATTDEIRASASELLASVDASTVVLVGPPSVPSRDGLETVDAALEQAAEDNGARYVSALAWDLPFLPDGLHLTEEGHKEFARQVHAAIPLP